MYSFVTGEIAHVGEMVKIPLVKVGTLAGSPSGKKYRLTEKALIDGAKTYSGGYVNINHAIPEKGKIEESWFEGEFVWGNISGLTPKVLDIMGSAAYEGVSQESDPIEVSETPSYVNGQEVYDVTKLNGRGAAIVIYPFKPRCPLNEGCGVLTSSEVIETDDAGNTTSISYEYDLGRMNNKGNIVKIREFTIWLSGSEMNNEDVKKERILMEASYGQLGSFDVYDRNPDLAVGDEMTLAQPIHTVEVTVSGYVEQKHVTSRKDDEILQSSEKVIPHLNTNPAKTNLLLGGVTIDEKEIELMKSTLATKEAEVATLTSALAAEKEGRLSLETRISDMETKFNDKVNLAVSAILEKNKEAATLAELKIKAKRMLSAELYEKHVTEETDAKMLSAVLEIIEANGPKSVPGATSGYLPKDHVEDDESNTCRLVFDAVTGKIGE